MKRVDKKNHLLLFSSFDHDGHFVDSIIDKDCDVERPAEEKIIDTLCKRTDST